MYNAGQLAPGLVLPVVIQQPREDGEVGQGEDHADSPQPGLPGPALRGSGAQQTGVNSEHLMQIMGGFIPCVRELQRIQSVTLSSLTIWPSMSSGLD